MSGSSGATGLDTFPSTTGGIGKTGGGTGAGAGAATGGTVGAGAGDLVLEFGFLAFMALSADMRASLYAFGHLPLSPGCLATVAAKDVISMIGMLFELMSADSCLGAVQSDVTCPLDRHLWHMSRRTLVHDPLVEGH